MAAQMSRDVAWITQTCTLGYDVMGKTYVFQSIDDHTQYMMPRPASDALSNPSLIPRCSV